MGKNVSTISFKEIEEEIIREAIQRKSFEKTSFNQTHLDVLRKYKMPLARGANLLLSYRKMLEAGKINREPRLEELLKFKRVRTLSGVAPVAILTKVAPCPGDCVFCPTEEKMPKSYLSDEPAVMRAIRAKFDAKEQVKARIFALEANGNPTDKVELIVMGGTFSALEKEYQNKFIKGALDGLNEKDSRTIDEAQTINEKAKHRCVGLTLETRPDFITEDEIINMRKLGATRVEIGVQTLDEDILKLTRRGHTNEQTIYATKLLKDAGFKVGYHMMPNLPQSSPEKDRNVLNEIFENNSYRPDQLKIYPCVAVAGSELYGWYKDEKYKPYNDNEIIELLVNFKTGIPHYVRISRLFRDIPTHLIGAGTKLTNLRQIIEKEMRQSDLRCRCIRCREVRDRQQLNPKDIKLFIEKYKASDGEEYFISYEDEKRETIFAFLRLRIPSNYFTGKEHFINELNGSAIVRELHTYGQLTPIGDKGEAVQHLGLGKKLLKKAEEIAKSEYKISKLAVISGIGAREYYYNLGYKLTGTYVAKELV